MKKCSNKVEKNQQIFLLAIIKYIVLYRQLNGLISINKVIVKGLCVL